MNQPYFKNRKEKIKPYGQMVDVFDGQMHVSRMGDGKHTIVCLSGLGIGLPSADFGPLMRRLSQTHTVVSVEYFGVGFSSQTKRPRTARHYVEEIQSALQNAKLNAPYVLMAHSFSSVYCEFYASTYPDEVKVIISLDGTSTAYIGADMPSFVKKLLVVAKFQQAIGLTSVLAPLVTNKGKLLRLGYSKKEVDDILSYAGFAINNNILDQISGMTDCIKETNVLPYPKRVPYLKIISRKTYETKNKQINMSPQSYQKEHLARIGEHAAYMILDGSHFIYLHQVDRISDITNGLLAELDL